VQPAITLVNMANGTSHGPTVTQPQVFVNNAAVTLGQAAAGGAANNGLYLLTAAQQEIMRRGSNGGTIPLKVEPESLMHAAGTIPVRHNAMVNGGKPNGMSSAMRSDKQSNISLSPENSPEMAARSANGIRRKADDELSQTSTNDGQSKKNAKVKTDLTDDEKRKNFLERNRQAALKCRQRKKQWLANLQSKVEYLTNDNENLQNQVTSQREEIFQLKTMLLAHKDCPIAAAQAAGGAIGMDGGMHHGPAGVQMLPGMSHVGMGAQHMHTHVVNGTMRY